MMQIDMTGLQNLGERRVRYPRDRFGPTIVKLRNSSVGPEGLSRVVGTDVSFGRPEVREHASTASSHGTGRGTPAVDARSARARQVLSRRAGFLSRLFRSRRRRRALVADLTESYRAEIAQATQLRVQAEGARYPQMARELQRLADVEERHAGWLRDHLASHGSPVPDVGPPRVIGNNPWQRVVAAYHAAVAKRRRLLEQIYRWDPEEPETVTLLRRIEREDKLELAAYQALSMRSDPLAAH